MLLGIDMDAAGAEVGAGVEAGVGAEVPLEISLGVSSKGNEASALRESIKAAGTSEAVAENCRTDAPEAALRAAAGAEARATAGAGKGARTGPARRGAKSAEIEKKVTRGEGISALLPDVAE